VNVSPAIKKTGNGDAVGKHPIHDDVVFDDRADADAWGEIGMLASDLRKARRLLLAVKC
jgi:hypothetical protein